MTADAVVRARINEQTKNEAAAVLKAMGLTVSDAFRLMMVKIAKEKALPVRAAGSERGNDRDDEGCSVRRADDRRPARKADRQPECGMLNSPAAFGATTSARNRDGTALLETVIMLAKDEPLPRRYFDHPLSGEWRDHRDRQIKPDLILIYRKPDDEALELVRLSSHSELVL